MGSTGGEQHVLIKQEANLKFFILFAESSANENI